MAIIPVLTLGVLLVLFWKKKVEKQLFCLILCGNLLGLFLTVREEFAEKRTEITDLERGRFGEGVEEVELEAVTEDGQKVEVTVQVPERRYTAEQAEKLLSEKLQNLDELILGANSSFSRIEQNLNLPSSFSDSPVTVEWMTDQPSVLDWDGTIGENAGSEGTRVCLEGILTLQNQKMEYSRMLTVYASPEEDTLSGRLQETADRLNQDGTDETYHLPDTVDGQAVRWYQKTEQTGFLVTMLSLLAGGLAVLSARKKKEQAIQKKQAEMQRDYPELVGKMQMLLGAGISMRRVFERIALDYKTEQAQSKKERKRWAYEEAARTWYEMESGVSEQEAYERFGMRCGIPSYKSLSVLLVQNLNKGGRGLVPLLEQEAQAAFEARKRLARTEGEKAAVRLLFPMGLMLLVVLVILMAPAFLTF